MRFDFSRFLLDIEHRSRRFRGLSFACRLLFYGSLVSIAAILCLRWGIPDLSREILLTALLIPITLALAAFGFGWWKRPSLPTLLLQLDDRLASGARISSLYEERLRGRDSFVRQRLESLVETLSQDWKRGLVPQRRTFSFLSAGLSGILIAGVLLFAPLPFPEAASMEAIGQSESSGAQIPQPMASEVARPASSDGTAAPLESRDEVFDSSTGDPQETKPLGANEELSLDSVLDDLSNLSRGRTQVDLPTTSDELLELVDAQDQARQALSDMLEELQQQMGANPRPLTQQESRQLQDLASQTGDPAIEDMANDLANESNPDQIGEQLQDLMDEMDPNADDPESAPETNEDTGDGSRQDSPQSTEVSGDEEAGQKFLERTAERLEEQANAEAEQDGQSQQPAESQNEDSQDPSQGGQPQMRMSGDGEDLSDTGGEDGMGGPLSEGPEPGTVGFVHEEAPATVGEQGEFLDEFVTKGVPVEMAPSQGSENTHFVDFERMDSILQDRNLPDEAQASIRRYFELITQPEGGS
ncbi:DUF4175 domain-containing protein [Candidatus Bipolaricaulota bacterium]|nr:DUF4175 domain-containing protein [Candidatus Bipolaricaulota bacterium]